MALTWMPNLPKARKQSCKHHSLLLACTPPPQHDHAISEALRPLSLTTRPASTTLPSNDRQLHAVKPQYIGSNPAFANKLKTPEHPAVPNSPQHITQRANHPPRLVPGFKPPSTPHSLNHLSSDEKKKPRTLHTRTTTM